MESHTASQQQEGGIGLKGEEGAQGAKPSSPEGQAHKGKENKGDGKGIPAQEKEDKLSVLADQLLRLQAEFDNYKKRTAAEKERISGQSEAKIMLRMLPIYEEMGIASQEAQKIHDEALRKGIQLVLGKLRSTFEKEGLSQMNTEGEKFDPYKHDAAMAQESELPEGQIIRCISPGYIFRGNILRHALVAVSSGKRKEEKGNGEGQGKGVEKGDGAKETRGKE